MNTYQNLSGKTEKISQYTVGSAPPSCFGTGHVTVLSTPLRKMEYYGVCQHRCSSALDFVLPVRSGRSKENSLIKSAMSTEWDSTRDFGTYRICANVSNKRTCWRIYQSYKSTFWTGHSYTSLLRLGLRCSPDEISTELSCTGPLWLLCRMQPELYMV